MGRGAGISNNGALTLEGSTLSNNSALCGGGLENRPAGTARDPDEHDHRQPHRLLRRRHLQHRHADGSSRAPVSGNTSSDHAGGIDNDATMSIEGSTVTGNSAPYCAGILNYVGATLTLMEQHGEQQQCREFRRWDRQSGRRDVTLEGTTITGNRPFGGGIYITDGAVILLTSTVSGNTATVAAAGSSSSAACSHWTRAAASAATFPTIVWVAESWVIRSAFGLRSPRRRVSDQ